MKTFVVALALVVFSQFGVYAQTGVPTSWTLRIYQPGSATALNTLAVPVASVTCNQAPVSSTPPATNPTTWRWDDPATAGRDCVYADTTRLIALADGNYEGTAVASNADGVSAESARVPFVRRRANPPGVPMGLRLIP